MAETAVATQLAYRTPKGVGILKAAPEYEEHPGLNGPERDVTIRCSAYSPNGLAFGWAEPTRVVVVNAETGAQANELPLDNVYELEFSPLGTYLITWQRPSKDESGNTTKNLKIWRTSNAGPTQEPVGAFVQKNQTGWNLQWTAEGDKAAGKDIERDTDGICARMVTNEVHYLKVDSQVALTEKLIVEGCSEFALCPTDASPNAVFVPGKHGTMSTVKIFGPVYRHPDQKEVENSKSFWNADKIQLKWDNKGARLIVLAQTDVDKSNKSYYGNTFLYVMDRTGKVNEQVVLDKEGPIHDIAWNPTADPSEFAITYGFMPAKTTIFNNRGKAKFSFDLGMRNTVAYSPHGRYLLVAGFGNLNGQMDLYDLSANYKKITTVDAPNSSVCEWSPDGTHILTATTSPRLRVDNGVRIWHISGKLMYNRDFPELYEISWRPQPLSLHPLPAAPLKTIPEPHPSAAAFLASRKTPAKPAGAYRPPGARGASTPMHFKREDEGGTAFSAQGLGTAALTGPNGAFGGNRRRDVPGAESASTPPGGGGGGVSLAGYEHITGGNAAAASKTAAKNKKKREAKKAREAEAGKGPGLSAEGGGAATNGVGGGPPARGASRSPDRRGHVRSRSKNGPQPPGRERGMSRGRGPGAGGGPPPAQQQQPPQQQHPPEQQPSQQQAGTKSARPGTANNATELPAPPAPPPQAHTPAYLDTAAAAAMAPSLNITEPTPTTAMSALDEKSPFEKRLRGLHKKLRAIEELKMKQAAGVKLEMTQRAKIDGESQVREELQSLGGGEEG